MTRPLAIPENQVRAIIRAARKEGARIEVKIGAAVITVFPSTDRDDEREVDREEDFAL